MAKVKSTTLAPIRISEVEQLEITKRANQLFPETSGRNISKYIRHLIEEDLNSTRPKKEREEECKEAEKLFLQKQLVRLGNNLNQIAHALNIIKKREKLDKVLEESIFSYYEELRKISFSIQKLSQ